MITSDSVRIRLFAALGLALVFAAAHGEESACAVKIPKDRLTEFLVQMRFNPAIRDGEIVGFRLCEKFTPGVLPELGLRSGDLLTHFCGAKANDAFSAEEVLLHSPRANAQRR